MLLYAGWLKFIIHILHLIFFKNRNYNRRKMKKVKEKFLKLNPFGLLSCILSVRRFTHGRRWHGIEDFILIKKIQSGDTDAFEIIVRKYYQSIYLFCCRRLNGNPDTAADITQDVFLKLLENIQSVRKIGKFQNYLLTIAVNTCNNYTKKAKPLYGCTYGLQGWNVSIQSSLHYASSIYNLTFLQMDSVSRMGKAVGKITERIRPTGTIKKMWRFGGQRGRPTPIGRWNLPADRSALTIAATSGRALIRFPLSIWGQPPAKWKSAASAPTRAK